MADTGSIAHKFVDIDGIGRGVERFSVFRYIEGETEPECDKAALDNLGQVETSRLHNHLNAEDSSTQSLLPDLDRMFHSRQLPNAEAEKISHLNQRSVPTEEERRLLGGSVKNDPEAVSIAKPVTRHSVILNKVGSVRSTTLSDADGRKIIPPGPQPRNTLSRVTFPIGSAVNRKAAPNSRGRTQHALAVEVRKGSNVNSLSNTKERDETLSTPPSAKRRKLDRRSSTASSDQTDPLDQISPHAMSFHNSQEISKPLSRAPSTSANSHVSSLPMKRHGSFEYRMVEEMMDSNPSKSKKQRHNDNRNHIADHILLPPSPRKRSSMSNPIDISGDESQVTKPHSKEIPRHNYRGTARQPPSVSKRTKSNTSETLKERAQPTKSPFFDRPGPPTNRANANVKQKSNSGTAARASSPGLAQKFVAADGTRRGSDVNASSDADELQLAPTTVGQKADPDAVFTIKDMRSISPLKQSSSTLRAATTPTDDVAILPPSIVKSDFASSNVKSRTSGRPIRPVTRDQEAKLPWSVDLGAISLPGKLVKNDDLGLVFDRSQEDYYIQMCGSIIKSTHSGLRIQPRKLNRVFWEKGGNKVRLESSRSGMEENVLDLELKLERDVTILLRRLQTSNAFSVVGKDSEYMQKIFERRRSEMRIVNGSLRPEEIEFVTHSRQRNDLGKCPAPLGAEKTSHQRQIPSVADELVHGATHDTDMAAARPESRMPAITNGLPEESRSKGILARVKPDHNEHLNPRRSTRNSGAHDGESLLSKLDAIPYEEKYSVRHGLGDPWKKPLTYPKIGKNKTTVEWSDLERLDEGEFLNDNLIGFYLRYLEQRLLVERPELAKRVYFFNTFFFTTLTSAHKGRKRFNYEGVQKWTRFVDLFTYNYVIVPINEQAHWYLAIICNLPALERDLAMPEDEATSPVEDGSAISKRECSPTEERASSPTNPSIENESKLLPSTVMESDERKTRDSFLQLSLDNDTQLPAGDELGLHEPEGPVKARHVSEDKEMLDSQIEDTMPEFAISKEAKAHPAPAEEQIEELENPVEDQGRGIKVVAKSRKVKRKSLPAPITKVNPAKPAIITFDSLGQPRGQTIRILKDYLREEAKAKRSMEFEDSQIKGINAKRIPQQDNFSDCGVFLLGYVDTFLGLETDPKDFITTTIQQTRAEKDWPKLVPSRLRASIRNQVQELHKVQTDERREESAKKSGKIPEKTDKKMESSPSRAPDQTKIIQEELGKASVADGVSTVTSKTPGPSSLDMAQAKDVTLEAAHRCEEEESDKNGDALEELLRVNELKMAKSEEFQRLYNSDNDEAGVYDGERPPYALEEPSVIMVDSQSQRNVPASKGVANSSLSSGKQSYPASASSKIINPNPLSFEKEKSPELPSEIPDSQNSDTSRQIAKIPDKPAPVVSIANENTAPLTASLIFVSDGNRGLPDPQEGRNEHSKRRKTGSEDEVDVQEVNGTADMVFTMEKVPERREEHKGPSKRRKRSAKEASKEVQEIPVHVIDD